MTSTDIVAAINDPIGTLVEDTRKLQDTAPDSFAKDWLLRSLKIDLHRYSMEDAFVDTKSETFKAAVAALEQLSLRSDWITPLLEEYLLALHGTAQLPQLPYKRSKAVLTSPGRIVHVVERQSITEGHFWISSTTASNVLILEESLGSPKECQSVHQAFSDKLVALKASHGVNRLCFIEKEMGPVGAISMLSSLVISTGLPACIFRETHWTRDMSIAADRPVPGDRIAIVYDLVVTGAGIKCVADAIAEQCGAHTVGAVVLCGYGPKRSRLETTLNPDIQLEALEWRTNVHGPAFEYSSSRDLGETSTDTPMSRQQSGGLEQMDRKSEGAGGNYIPPGSYTRQTLPPISAAARQIVDAVWKGAENDIQQRTGTAKVGSNGLLKLKKSPVKGLRVKLR